MSPFKLLGCNDIVGFWKLIINYGYYVRIPEYFEFSFFSIYFPHKFGNITFLKSGYFLIHIDIIMAYEFNLLSTVPVYGSTERKKIPIL